MSEGPASSPTHKWARRPYGPEVLSYTILDPPGEMPTSSVKDDTQFFLLTDPLYGGDVDAEFFFNVTASLYQGLGGSSYPAPPPDVERERAPLTASRRHQSHDHWPTPCTLLF